MDKPVLEETSGDGSGCTPCRPFVLLCRFIQAGYLSTCEGLSYIHSTRLCMPLDSCMR